MKYGIIYFIKIQATKKQIVNMMYKIHSSIKTKANYQLYFKLISGAEQFCMWEECTPLVRILFVKPTR
jgi:hypothetical protein